LELREEELELGSDAAIALRVEFDQEDVQTFFKGYEQLLPIFNFELHRTLEQLFCQLHGNIQQRSGCLPSGY